MPQVIFLKLGGSAITDKTRAYKPREDVIRSAARAVRRVREAKPDLHLVLGHGSGSFGHFAAKQSGFGEPDNWRAYAETGAAANRLNRIVADIFLQERVPVISVQPSASARCHDGELQYLETETIRRALDKGLVPLVYGDVAFDETRGMAILSTEKIFAYLAPLLHPEIIIYAGEVDGIFNVDPLVDPSARLIPEITPVGFAEIEAGIGAAIGWDVTGGMLDKVRRTLDLVQRFPGLDVYVIRADETLIERTLQGDHPFRGTSIHTEETDFVLRNTREH